MQLAARWSIVPLLAVTGAAGLLAAAREIDTLDDPFLDDTLTVEDEADRPQYRPEYVPISGRVLHDDDACLPFLAVLTARPQWTLQIADTATSCMGTRQLDRFEVSSDGVVAWRPRDLTERRLQLTPAQLERIRALDTLSCEVPRDRGYADRNYDVGLGIFDGDRAGNGGARLSSDSPAGAALAEVLDEAVGAYTQRRLDEIGAIDLRLDVSSWDDTWSPATAVYRVELKQDRVLRVWHGDKLVHANTVTPRELVDTVDWVTQTVADRAGRSRELLFAAGSLTVASGTYPMALWKLDSYELVPHGLLYYAANSAPFYEQKR